jgi:hypothetical protein
MRLPWLQMRRRQMRLEALRGLWRLRRLLPGLGPLPLVLGLKPGSTHSVHAATSDSLRGRCFAGGLWGRLRRVLGGSGPPNRIRGRRRGTAGRGQRRTG